MSKAADRLREIKVYNDYDVLTIAAQIGVVPVAVLYRPQDTGRAYQGAAWQVHHLREKTDPDGHWRDYGHRTFTVSFYERGIVAENGRSRAAAGNKAALAAALAWASERYGVAEWGTVPGLPRGHFPAEAAAKVKAMLREHAKASK